MLQPTTYFDCSDPAVAQFFDGDQPVWAPLQQLAAHVSRLTGDTQTLDGEIMPGAFVGPRPIFIADSARIEPGAYIHGPAYIGPHVVVRHGAFVRENVIALEGAVIGHATEVKNSLLLPHAHAPHFNYVGDSILGHYVNLGAGTKLSNLALVSQKDQQTGLRPTIQLQIGEDELVDTGLAKLGAILGDEVQTGCNSVLNPACLVGPRSLLYPNMSLRKGIYPADSILKLRQTIKMIPRRD